MVATAKACEACGRMIEFHESPNGRPMPVERVRNVYAMGPDGKLVTLREQPAPGAPQRFVSHFELCTDPDRFSRGRRA
jgi:hypothetical protein